MTLYIYLSEKVRGIQRTVTFNRMLRIVQLFLVLVPIASASLMRAQGGPPFITDDPGTPGNRHWEINLGWIADHNPGNAYYEVPDFDINYGWGDRIQLKYELPIAVATDPNNTTRAGLGESLLGIKWRPYEYHRAGEKKSDENMLFSIGTYPQASINNPTSAVRRGIVENGPQYYLPVEFTAKVGPIGLGDFRSAVGDIGEGLFHVRLAGAVPNIADQHVVKRDGLGLARDRDVRRLGGGLQSLQRDDPVTVRIRRGAAGDRDARVT